MALSRNPPRNLICVAMSVLMLFAGFWVFYKKQDHFVLYI